MTQPLQPYPPVELTEREMIRARRDAEKLITKYGFANLGKMLGMLVRENCRLVKECNQHRAARGFEPMKTYKV